MSQSDISPGDLLRYQRGKLTEIVICAKQKDMHIAVSLRSYDGDESSHVIFASILPNLRDKQLILKADDISEISQTASLVPNETE